MVLALRNIVFSRQTGQCMWHTATSSRSSPTDSLRLVPAAAALVHRLAPLGLLGSWLFSRFYDGHKKGFIAASLVGRPLPCWRCCLRRPRWAPPLSIAWCGVRARDGLLRGSVVDSHQHTIPKDQASVAMSIYSGLFNLGIGAGSAIGGAGDAAGGCRWPRGWSDCRRAVVTVGVMFTLMRRKAAQA